VDRMSHQRVPITLELEGGGTLHVLSHGVSPSRLKVELGPEDVIPPAGVGAKFRALVAGSPVAGDARVRGATTVETADGRVMLLELDVTGLDATATHYLRRSAFRDRVLAYAEKHPDGRRILASADLVGPTAPTSPDTRPVNEREGRWVEPSEPVLRSDRPAGGTKGARKRPRPGRHTWELEDRFRSRPG